MPVSASRHRFSFFQAILFGYLVSFSFSDSTFSNTPCDGLCVPLAQCRSDFGSVNIVDLRYSSDDVELLCNHYLEVCCPKEDVIPKINDIKQVCETGASVAPSESAEPVAPAEPATRAASVAPVAPAAPAAIKTFRDCGIRNQDGIGFHITHVKHNETEFGEFPWVIAIMQAEESQLELLEPSSKYICGGSLISPNVVLTAAHCVMNRNPETLIARAGEWDIMTKNEVLDYQEQRVEQVIIHPNFHHQLLFHNLALLVLENQFVANEHIQLICLPPQNLAFNSDSCFATGWGKADFVSNHSQAILKKIQLPTVSKHDCQSALKTTTLGSKFRLHDSFICAGGQEGVDTCTGDGGSPLMCPVPGFQNKYYLTGNVAWGIGCGQADIPGVYVRTSLHTKWIREEIRKINSGDIGVTEQVTQQATDSYEE